MLRSQLKLICEYELHSLPNKIVAQRIMVKITSRGDHLWSAIFCVIVYWYVISSKLLIVLLVMIAYFL